MIIKHKDIIIEKIKDKIIKKYSVEIKNIFYFYKYVKTKLIIQKLTPEKIIKNIINELKNDKYYDKIPDFISRFLYKIENKLEDCKDKIEKQNIIKSFDDKNYFLEKLNDKMIESIEDFLHQYLGVK